MKSFTLKYRLIAMASALLMALTAVAREDKSAGRVEAEAVVSPQQVYQGECFNYTVELICDNPNIGNISRLTRIDRSGLSLVTRLDTSHRPYTDEKGNYVVEIISEIYEADHTGKIEIPGGRYRVDFLVPTTVYDPFWGYVRTNERILREVTVPSVSVKCKALPKAPDGFSGAVGSFEFDCENPDVYGSPGGEIQLIYTVEGEGLLSDVKAPEMSKSLPTGLKLKSITPYEQAYLKEGKVYSQTQFLCVVTAAEAGEYEISSVPFVYFNPDSKKYITVKSAACRVTVGEKRRKEATPQGQYVLNLNQTDQPPILSD